MSLRRSPPGGATLTRWWWAGKHGAFEEKHPSDRAAKPSGQNVALVVGSTGVVGAAILHMLSLRDAPGGPWKVYAVSRLPPPPWSAAALPPRVDHRHCDLSDPDELKEALKPLTDITHVFYVAWDPRRSEDAVRGANCVILNDVLSALVPNCPRLAHVCLQTTRKPFIDPLADVRLGCYEHSEDLPPPPPMDYSDLKEILVERLTSSKIAWSVHRTATIFGFSPGSSRNVVASLCVYAAICRREKKVLRWPGSRVAWEGCSDASDAELVAEHALWAALGEPKVKNQAFNCSNGDIFRWKQLWPMLALQYGMELECAGYEGEDERFRLQDEMAGKEAVWAEMVEEEGLHKTQLHEITSWSFVDDLFNMEEEHLDTMNKCKKYGFFGYRRTANSFNNWIEKIRGDNIVP